MFSVGKWRFGQGGEMVLDRTGFCMHGMAHIVVFFFSTTRRDLKEEEFGFLLTM